MIKSEEPQTPPSWLWSQKKKNPLSIERFRPISLRNTSYKIVTKILEKRMKKIMAKIILETQGGFIAGKQIMDNIIIVQEAIHSSLECKQQGMAIKLDMENAFDRVNHFFLFEIMQKMGFSKNFCRWMKACISSPWIAPLLNGRLVGFFQASWDLRQGWRSSHFYISS